MAEKEAQEIVAEARKYRQDKLKQAKLDASKEINDYKQLKDQQLKEFENKNEGGVESLEKEANAAIQTDLKDIKDVTFAKKQQVVDLLIKAVVSPVGGMHVNAQ